MCGICGIKRFEGDPITEDQISLLLVSNEHRGNDATGMALQQADGSVQVLKDDVPAYRFVTSKDFKGFIEANLKPDTVTFIGHTRAMTLGRASDNRNNHPVWNGKSAVVHNGMISNHSELFRKLEMERIGEVDSDVFRGILDKYGITKEAIKYLKMVEGSAAIVAISSEAPGKLILGRCGSPLIMASTPDALVWSSEKSAIHRAMRPVWTRFGFNMQPNRVDLAFMTMNDDSIYLIGDKIEWHDEFQTSHYYTKPNYRIHDNYQHKHQSKGPTAAWCKTCKAWRDINEKYRETPLYELYCTSCNKYFEDKPKGEKKGKRKAS